MSLDLQFCIRPCQVVNVLNVYVIFKDVETRNNKRKWKKHENIHPVKNGLCLSTAKYNKILLPEVRKHLGIYVVHFGSSRIMSCRWLCIIFFVQKLKVWLWAFYPHPLLPFKLNWDCFQIPLVAALIKVNERHVRSKEMRARGNAWSQDLPKD